MKKNNLKLGVVLSYISIFVSVLISLIYTPIMLKLLGQNEYGLYSLCVSLTSYLTLFSFGFGGAYYRFYSKFKNEKDEENISKLNGMFLLIYSIISLLIIIAGTIMVLNIENIFRTSLTIVELGKAKVLSSLMILTLVIGFMTVIFDSNIVVHEKFVFQKSLVIVKHILSPLISIPLLLLGYGSIGLVIVSVVVTILYAIFVMIYSFSKLKISFCFKNLEFKLFKSLGAFSFYIFVIMIVTQINFSVDKIILGVVSNTAMIAIYTIGAEFNVYFNSFSTAITNIFVPRINRIVAKNTEDNTELNILFPKIGRIQFFILGFVFLGFVFFGPYFIKIWAGSGYRESYYVALLLLGSMLFVLVQNLGNEILQAKNMHKFRAIVFFIVAIINIVISIPLCKLYGSVGAALGTAISVTLSNIIMNIYYKKEVKLDITYFWKEIIKIFPGLILPIVVGVVLKYFGINSIIKLVSFAIIFIIVYFVSIYFFSFNEYEKNTVKKIFKRKEKII